MNRDEDLVGREPRRQRRRRKLIKPRLQLRVVGTFVGLSALSLILQAQMVALEIARMSADAPGRVLTSDVVVPIVWRSLGMSCLCILPLVIALGVLATFRVAGPVFNLERHLDAIARGEDPGPCRLRRGDDLHGLAAKVNRAVETLRSAPESLVKSPTESGDRAA